MIFLETDSEVFGKHLRPDTIAELSAVTNKAPSS